MKLDTMLSARDLHEVPKAAKAAEDAGFDAIWSMEAGNRRFPAAGAPARAPPRDQNGPGGRNRFPGEPDGARLYLVRPRAPVRGPLRAGAWHPGQGPYRAALRDAMGAASAQAARVPGVAGRDFQMLERGRLETFVPGQVLQLLADDAVLRAAAASVPDSDLHRGRERAHLPPGGRTMRRPARASVEPGQVPARIPAAASPRGLQ